ncbi:MAG: DUF3089 domain-containing protein [Candidatus Xenobiia bacterium LiM19]
MKKSKCILVIIIALSVISIVFAPTDCICGSNNGISVANASGQSNIDYSQSNYWLSLPATTGKPVDIFYVYPTVWKRAQGDPQVCEINNISMIAGATRQFQSQATAFEPVGNIFAPFYRQATSEILALPLDRQRAILSGMPKTDVFAAFDYYIKNLNKGRPFILAGHSQGSNILVFLLSEYMKQNPDVYKRMVAAYVIGYSITPDYLAQNPHLKFATGPDDTGVIVSYNTEAPVLLPPGDPVVLPGALVINPITWTTDETLAAASQNKGSIMMNPDATVALDTVPVMNYADAQIDKSRNALICSSVNQQLLIPINRGAAIGVYHAFDYAFYYFNIRQNAANRVNKFLAETGFR